MAPDSVLNNLMNLKNFLMVGAMALGMSWGAVLATSGNGENEISSTLSIRRVYTPDGDNSNISIYLSWPADGSFYVEDSVADEWIIGNGVLVANAFTDEGDLVLTQDYQGYEVYGYTDDLRLVDGWYHIDLHFENVPELEPNYPIYFCKDGGQENDVGFVMPWSYVLYEEFVCEGSSYNLFYYEGHVSDAYNYVTYAYNPISSDGVVGDIVDILTGGIIGLGSGIGSSVNGFIQSLVFSGNDLSVYFVFICVFGGIALAVGLTTKIFNWLQNIGA